MCQRCVAGVRLLRFLENSVLITASEYDVPGSLPYGNEYWEFDNEGYMRRRDTSINDYKIDESERKFR